PRLESGRIILRTAKDKQEIGAVAITWIPLHVGHAPPLELISTPIPGLDASFGADNENIRRGFFAVLLILGVVNLEIVLDHPLGTIGDDSSNIGIAQITNSCCFRLTVFTAIGIPNGHAGADGENLAIRADIKSTRSFATPIDRNNAAVR